MVHHRQRLALCFETGDNAPGIHAELYDFERHAAFHRFFLLGQVNNPTAAFADFLQQPVPANPLAGLLSRASDIRAAHRSAREKRLTRLMRLDQRLHLPQQQRILPTLLADVGLLVHLRFPIQGGFEDFTGTPRSL